ncbi:type 1 glutamine amidotransferase domain-containing protein [Pseudonocardia endophytica]|uniref:Putative intracellular protease/amidase n=1 Tax=Pseudonocardia endophytica TaxID=401976 RepID=A0A4R1I139_PSEEN|nr:type 1 glutamine amidotransferase domain-containing protein [Pseudonocardia endophytica]TCK27631.1 putative intracellular protease/amidase [Pseudonocardia endophytica]
MTTVLLAVTGSDHWTLADGSKHPCGYWPEELVAPHRIFTAAGFTITIATPGGVVPTPDEAGFSPEMNGGSAEVGEGLRNYISSISAELAAPTPLETIDPAGFDLVFVPGGHGPMEDLAVSESFGAQLNAFLDAGTPIAAVCHGPAGLLAARRADGSWSFDGYRLTAFSNVEEGQVGYADQASWLLEDRIKSEGGVVSVADAWAPKVVVDRTLYTGQNPASSEPLAEALVTALKA